MPQNRIHFEKAQSDISNLLSEMRPADEQGGEDEGGEEEVDDGHVDDHPVVVVDESAETSIIVRMLYLPDWEESQGPVL